jgi:serine/threonine protein phosphatase PrpC
MQMQEMTQLEEAPLPETITASGGSRTLRLDRTELSEGWAEKGRLPQIIASLKLGAKTDLGRVRENNEDKFEFHEPEDPAVLASKGRFYGVADGMGGHSAGQIACELALKTVIHSYYVSPSADTDEGLRRAIDEANALIFDTARMIPERHGMGTTLTAAVVRDAHVTIAQIGDSRAYLIRGGEITQLTDDHSWVAEQVRMGAMSLEDAQASPFRNIITRSIGTAATIEPDITQHKLAVGDTLVLCSDGLNGHLDAEEIRETAVGHSPSVAAMRLVEQANERGGRDNITALVLSVRSLDPYVPAADEPAAQEPVRKPEKRGWGLRR